MPIVEKFRRIMPLSVITDTLEDVQGARIFSNETYADALRTLGWAVETGILDGITLTDDLILPWSNEGHGRILSRQDEMDLGELKGLLAEIHTKVVLLECDLCRAPEFRNGALTNPEQGIRLLALRKMERAIVLADLLGAEGVKFRLGREGYDDPFQVNWNNLFSQFAVCLNSAAEQLKRCSGTNLRFLSISSQNLRRTMFLPTIGDWLGFCTTRLEKNVPWRFSPATMSEVTLPQLTQLYQNKMLGTFPFGGRLSNDACSAEGVFRAATQLWQLKQLGWHGIVELNAPLLRSEAIPNDREETRRCHIVRESVAFSAACEMSHRLTAGWREEMTPTEAAVMAMILMAGQDPDSLVEKCATYRDNPLVEKQRKLLAIVHQLSKQDTPSAPVVQQVHSSAPVAQPQSQPIASIEPQGTTPSMQPAPQPQPQRDVPLQNTSAVPVAPHAITTPLVAVHQPHVQRQVVPHSSQDSQQPRHCAAQQRSARNIPPQHSSKLTSPQAVSAPQAQDERKTSVPAGEKKARRRPDSPKKSHQNEPQESTPYLFAEFNDEVPAENENRAVSSSAKTRQGAHSRKFPAASEAPDAPKQPTAKRPASSRKRPLATTSQNGEASTAFATGNAKTVSTAPQAVSPVPQAQQLAVQHAGKSSQPPQGPQPPNCPAVSPQNPPAGLPQSAPAPEKKKSSSEIYEDLFRSLDEEERGSRR